jgi:hypothetical protein
MAPTDDHGLPADFEWKPGKSPAFQWRRSLVIVTLDMTDFDAVLKKIASTDAVEYAAS